MRHHGMFGAPSLTELAEAVATHETCTEQTNVISIKRAQIIGKQAISQEITQHIQQEGEK